MTDNERTRLIETAKKLVEEARDCVNRATKGHDLEDEGCFIFDELLGTNEMKGNLELMLEPFFWISCN